MTSIEAYSQFFKALSEPMRLRILYLLLNREDLCVCDFVTVMQAGQSLISRHLAYLKNAGWVKSHRQGTWMHYQIETTNLPMTYLETLKEQLSQIETCQQDLTSLETYETQERQCNI
ncbi:ArsR/SmtB family transcription factor [Hydrogenovibrio kuenenii]|uniref:ArsR/SmtB family transcription factor n=1 Tax=Hydrogenovibrio kuenenii TaxID=63658 RepID=UPI0004B85A67|nr:metalloregulator ArsR/SmtB family transcription factor [Hydrogenovibrio kuenenii]